MKSLYIIRHGETAYNKLGIVQGSGVDTDLNETGKAQAAHFYEKYQDIDFELIITSKLKRTTQTAQHFLDKGIPHLTTADINEINWGAHEGKVSTPESRTDYKYVSGEWTNGNYHARTHGGESIAELAERLHRFLAFLHTRPEQNILIVTHGRTLRALICLLKGEPLANMERYDHYNTGLVLSHIAQGKFEVALENDISHLPHYEAPNYGL